MGKTDKNVFFQAKVITSRILLESGPILPEAHPSFICDATISLASGASAVR